MEFVRGKRHEIDPMQGLAGTHADGNVTGTVAPGGAYTKKTGAARRLLDGIGVEPDAVCRSAVLIDLADNPDQGFNVLDGNGGPPGRANRRKVPVSLFT